MIWIVGLALPVAIYVVLNTDKIVSSPILLVLTYSLVAFLYYQCLLESRTLRSFMESSGRLWFRLRFPVRLFAMLALMGIFIWKLSFYFPLLCIFRGIHILLGKKQKSIQTVNKEVSIELELKTGTAPPTLNEIQPSVNLDNFHAQEQKSDQPSPLNEEKKSIDRQTFFPLPSNSEQVFETDPVKLVHNSHSAAHVRFSFEKNGNNTIRLPNGKESSSKDRSGRDIIVSESKYDGAVPHSLLISPPLFGLDMQTVLLHPHWQGKKRKSDFLSDDDDSNLKKKTSVAAGRPRVKRKVGHLNRLGVGVGGEGDEIYFPEVAVKKKVRFQDPAPTSSSSSLMFPSTTGISASGDLTQPFSASSSFRLPAQEGEASREGAAATAATVAALDVFSSSSLSSQRDDPPLPAATSSSSPFSLPSSQGLPDNPISSFTFQVPSGKSSLSAGPDSGTGLGLGSLSGSKVPPGGRPPLSPSTSLATGSKDSAVGGPLLGIAFNSKNGESEEGGSNSFSNTLKSSFSFGGTAGQPVQQAQLQQTPDNSFSSAFPLANSSSTSAWNPSLGFGSGSSGNPGGSNQPFSFSSAANQPGPAAGNPFSSSFSVGPGFSSTDSGQGAGSSGFALGAPTSSASRRKVSVRGRR